MGSHDRRRKPRPPARTQPRTQTPNPTARGSNQQHLQALPRADAAPQQPQGLDIFGQAMTDNDAVTLKGGYDAAKSARTGQRSLKMLPALSKGGQRAHAMIRPLLGTNAAPAADDGVLSALRRMERGKEFTRLSKIDPGLPTQHPMELLAKDGHTPGPAKGLGRLKDTKLIPPHLKFSTLGYGLGVLGGALSARDLNAALVDYQKNGLTGDNLNGMISNGAGVGSAVTGLASMAPSLGVGAMEVLSKTSGVLAAGSAGMAIGNLGNQWSRDGSADAVARVAGIKDHHSEGRGRSFSDIAADGGLSLQLWAQERGWGDTAAKLLGGTGAIAGGLVGGLLAGVKFLHGIGAGAYRAASDPLGTLGRAGKGLQSMGASALKRVGSWFGWGKKKKAPPAS